MDIDLSNLGFTIYLESMYGRIDPTRIRLPPDFPDICGRALFLLALWVHKKHVPAHEANFVESVIRADYVGAKKLLQGRRLSPNGMVIVLDYLMTRWPEIEDQIVKVRKHKC